MKKLLMTIMLIAAVNSAAFAGATYDLDIANASFEGNGGSHLPDGSIAGWTRTAVTGSELNQFGVISGSLGSSPAGAQDGTFYVSALGLGSQFNTGDVTRGIYTFIDVSAYASEIDAGDATVNFWGFAYGETGPGDNGFMEIEFYNGGPTPLATATSGDADTSFVWTSLHIEDVVVPTTTRSIRLTLWAHKNATNNIDAGFDNISGSITVPAPGAVLLGSIGITVVGWLKRRKTL